MYDWTDDFVPQLILNYPGWKDMINQAADLGDIDKVIELTFALETDGVH